MYKVKIVVGSSEVKEYEKLFKSPVHALRYASKIIMKIVCLDLVAEAIFADSLVLQANLYGTNANEEDKFLRTILVAETVEA